ncbi:MAG TPA: type II toxin-antitoxin system RelE/ParE family toxin [Solirubrobacteraceae bacterium]|nr:type II toxin-antitoxin system RelE/ParE family toxin [Solirubrobacteraceae bacterium]
MSNFQAVYYRDRSGREPVRRFIDRLAEDIQAALENQIDRLNLLSDAMPHLPFPHSSQVDGELRELRCHFGRQHYRVLYARSGRLLVLLHVFSKRTAKIDPRDIAVARERWDDFKARMDAKPRVPPRAAGHDAP